MRRLLKWLLLAVVLATAAVTVPAGLAAMAWARAAVRMVDAHVAYEVSHPGWSFPARVMSRPTPLDGDPKRLVQEAIARGYVEDCKDPGPGEYCAKPPQGPIVVPRSGDALEAVELGWLIGPDGELREHLPLDDAPKHLVEALLAAEDRDFATHHGVNLGAMIRAAWANAQEGSYAQGGSTLTMQLVRNLSQEKEKTVVRKLREIVTSVAVDRHLGKSGVLQMYLDAPYLGQQGSLSVCGFEAASKHYFGHGASELTLAEAATLAAILPAPGRFAPDRHPEAAKERRDRVLQAMAELYGYDVAEALATPIVTVPPAEPVERWPAYLSATRAWLEAHVDPAVLYGAGLRITVGVDPVAQHEAEELFPQRTKWLMGLVGKHGEGPLQSAGLILDVETGLVRAVYGGDDVTSTSFNRATQARRQPGSSFKPLVYALAFGSKHKDGRPFLASDTEPNSPRSFETPEGTWTPRNVGGEYTSSVCLAQGLTWSQNIATASLLEELGGPKPLISFADRLGFDTRAFPVEMGLALGQGEVTLLEMVQFAATVANGGRKIEGSPIVTAVDPAGVERIGPPQAGEQVLTPEQAALTRELMRLVIDVGTGGATRGAGMESGYAGPAMGKTGTTDSERDLWFVGSTPRLATGVWLGYDVPAPIGAAASDLAAPLWGWWLRRVTANTGELPKFPDEPKLVHKGVCVTTGKLPNGTCRVINAPFVPGTEPKQPCPIQHPPPAPVDTDADTDASDSDDTDAPKPKKPPGHESLWKRLAREAAERKVKADAEAAKAAGDTDLHGELVVPPPGEPE